MNFIVNFYKPDLLFLSLSSTVPHAALPEVNDLGNPQSEVALENLGQKTNRLSQLDHLMYSDFIN